MSLLSNVPLRDLAYYRTGGTCEALYAPSTVGELASTIREIKAKRQAWFLLGGGTNSLVIDEHFPGAVIVFKNLATLELAQPGGRVLRCGAGVENSAVARLALANSLAGAGWMNRLPGQIGGTVRMNARCYGGEISQIVTKVTAVSRDGEIKEYRDPSIFRGYKDTIFMTNGDVIADAEITLTPGIPAVIEKQMLFCESDRVGKGQFDHPSCGCVFKNDYTVGVSSGMLLEQAGAKALKHVGAEVSPGHANFVFNKGATSRAILEISFLMQDLVYERFGAWMEYEMEVLGVLPEDLRKRFHLKKPHRLDIAALEPLRVRMIGR